MFLKIPVCTRGCAEKALSRAPGVDFGGQEGAPRRPKWSPNAAQKRVGSGMKIQLVLEAVLGAVLRLEKGRSRIQAAVGAAGRRNGGGLRGGIRGGAKALEGALVVKSHTPLCPVGGRIQSLRAFRRPILSHRCRFCSSVRCEGGANDVSSRLVSHLEP